jgi:carboxypeptidase Taq
MTSESITKLRDRFATIDDIRGGMAVLGWDEQTKMPRGGTEARGERLATLGRIAHEMLIADETGRLIEDAEKDAAGLDFDSDDASLVRVARRDFDRSRVISSDLMAEAIRAASQGYATWIEAKANQDFPAFLPVLERLLEINRRFVEAYRTIQPDAAEDYDLLLENYEPGLTSREIEAAFAVLRDRTVPLVEQVKENAAKVDDTPIRVALDDVRQERLSMRVLKQLGFDEQHWRLDTTHHPFASSMAITDIRITTRYLPDVWDSALFSSMHEFGHGLYERQPSPSLARTPMAGGASMAWHESQSRMWENLVGRGRPFWDWGSGAVREELGDSLGGATADSLYRAVNKLQPSLIRVEADELTYNLHIILRFELERAMLNGDVPLKELREAWNDRMLEYLGVDVPNVSVGVLQDVHWSSGLFGYFPTYALGNILSLMLWQRINREIPELDDQFRAGEFGPLREWLGANVHRHGSKFLPKVLMQKVLGTDTLDPTPLTDYLEQKVADLYG